MEEDFDTDKIEKLRRLEEVGVVSEMCPEPNFWRFRVVKPLELPEEFREEYLRTGEVCWF